MAQSTILDHYQSEVNAIKIIIDKLKIKAKPLQRTLKTYPEDQASRTMLDMIIIELKNYRKLYRRAKCNIYDYKYRNTKNGKIIRKIGKQRHKQKMIITEPEILKEQPKTFFPDEPDFYSNSW